eukprot:351599-Chlamydomonas_euryale.AAC.9
MPLVPQGRGRMQRRRARAECGLACNWSRRRGVRSHTKAVHRQNVRSCMPLVPQKGVKAAFKGARAE